MSEAGGRRVRALLFDLDGTLASTHALVFVAVREVVRPFRGGLPEPTDDEIAATFGPVERGTIEAFANGRTDEGLEAFFERYADLARSLRPFEGIPVVLDAARAAGVRLGLATGRSRRGTDLTLRAIGLEGAFPVIVTGDDVRRPKPDPEPVAILAARVGVDPAASVYVGDTPADVIAARGAGAISAAALWGARDPVALRDAGPDHVLTRPEDLLAFVDRLP